MDHPLNNPVQPRAARLKVFGVGRAGIAIIDRLMQSSMADTEFVAVATDAACLASTAVGQKLLLESKRLRGLGTGGDPVRGGRAAEENLAELKSLCQPADVVFVVTGLGGGTGTGVGPVIARVARQAGALVTGFAVTPFECEGEARGLNATRGLEALKTAADGVICLSNNKVLSLIDDTASVTDAFARSAELMAEGVKAVWRLMKLKGPIELSFEDLCAVLKDRHSESLFAVAEGAGTDRVTEVLEQLHAHPLLDQGRDLERADSVLVSVVSGSQLGMAETNRLMKDINECCHRARVSMGVGLSEEFEGRLVVTVIASCRGTTHKRDLREVESQDRAGGVADEESDELFPRLLAPQDRARATKPGYVPPPPDITPDRMDQVASRNPGTRRPLSRPRQEQLPLEVVSKGRFEKGEPTVLHGEDLDVPTYVRRGLALN
jgi:cell division protein FtsZ